MKLSRSKLRQLILEEFSLAVVHPAESPCDVSRGATLSEVLADWLGLSDSEVESYSKVLVAGATEG